MSRRRKKREVEVEEAPSVHEEEFEAGTIEAGDELEAALREAEESVDHRLAEREDVARADTESGGGAAESADKMTIELLSEELRALKSEYEARMEEAKDADDKFLRLQAEFENFRRRTLKEREEAFHYGHQNLVKDLLPVVDNLERAIAHGEQNEDGDFQSLLQGIDLVYHELLGALSKHGVETIEADGQAFDPAVHEAMTQVPHAELPPNTVASVLQRGYRIRDRMLRPARVIVTRSPDAEETQGSNDEEN